jgi:hypothetical protein
MDEPRMTEWGRYAKGVRPKAERPQAWRGPRGENPGESIHRLPCCCVRCAFVFADGVDLIHYLHSITTTFREIPRQHYKYAILSAYPR